jgi:hypothetical protein
MNFSTRKQKEPKSGSFVKAIFSNFVAFGEEKS